MPSLIDLRRRIRSVKNTQQVTKAMKMVSAAKLRRAQERVLAARPYAQMFREMLADVAGTPGSSDWLETNPLLARRPEERITLILLTADRGLAGGFNSNLNRAAQEFLREHAGSQVEMYTLGRKGRDFFRKRGENIVLERTGISQAANYAQASAIAKEASEHFEQGATDAVYVLYNEFKSVLSQKVTLTRVLPIDVPTETSGADYIYEQPPDKLLGALLPRYVEIAIYQAMLESAASEHAARMTAMESASSNAGEVIEKLTLYMNRVRQASITKELIEVVSGAAALT